MLVFADKTLGDSGANSSLCTCKRSLRSPLCSPKAASSRTIPSAVLSLSFLSLYICCALAIFSFWVPTSSATPGRAGVHSKSDGSGTRHLVLGFSSSSPRASSNPIISPLPMPCFFSSLGKLRVMIGLAFCFALSSISSISLGNRPPANLLRAFFSLVCNSRLKSPTAFASIACQSSWSYRRPWKKVVMNVFFSVPSVQYSLSQSTPHFFAMTFSILVKPLGYSSDQSPAWSLATLRSSSARPGGLGNVVVNPSPTSENLCVTFPLYCRSCNSFSIPSRSNTLARSPSALASCAFKSSWSYFLPWWNCSSNLPG
mmetsp:Transcript_11798/g.21482  ORF Transcript_11798/g.21482 Transcript_11798/m.21482 type:complete len:314 (-) Transcript_11798:329-1270(-)